MLSPVILSALAVSLFAGAPARPAGTSMPADARRVQRADSIGAAAARFRALTAAARAVLAADGGRLWGARLDTLHWIGVAGAGEAGSKVYLTADPAVAGYAPSPAAVGVWTGPLPAGMAPANSSLAWAGRRWAMVLLPLPTDSADAVRLLVHEAMHVAQGGGAGAVLPRPIPGEAGAGAELLDRPEGRLWLRLEWRALDAALRSRGAAQQRAARDALLFRARRYADAVPAERRRERALDIAEGLPEYTAWVLTTSAAGARAFAPALGRAEHATSYVRSFPYSTGPAYAFLLDRRAPDWRRLATAAGDSASLQRLLLNSLPGAPAWLAAALSDSSDGAAAPASALASAAEVAGARYGLLAVRRAEAARWAGRERELAALRARFVDGPTLRIRPRTLEIVFDPGGQTPLAGAGTVMRGFVWRGPAGAELRAPEGALVSPDWREVRVPLDSAVLAAGPLGAGGTWSGAGWRLAVPAGWTAARAGTSWILTPPTDRR